MHTLHHVPTVVIIPAIILALAGFAPAPSPVAGITVTTLLDEYDDTDTGCSLREAITAANTDLPFGGCDAGSGIDTITIPAGTITFLLPGHEDDNISGDLDIYSSLNLVGAGMDKTTIDAAQMDRVIQIYGSVSNTVGITGLTLRNGRPPTGGGGSLQNSQATVSLVRVQVTNNTTLTDYSCAGIRNFDGIMTIDESIITGNTVGTSVSPGYDPIGGGICNLGLSMMSINHTTISNNHAGNKVNVIATEYSVTTGNGGGIFNYADLTINNSLIVNNSAGDISAQEVSESYNVAGGNGGGIYNNGELNITNSTLTGNKAGDATAPFGQESIGGTGGALLSTAYTIMLESVTITQNLAGTGGTNNGDTGGIKQEYDGTVTIHNSIIKGNDLNNLYCVPGTFDSHDFNIISDVIGCAITGTTTHNLASDPLLNALANNGGLTETMSLQTSSPAIDAGDPVSCPTDDQRGFHRPVDGDAVPGAVCDIGAFEYGYTPFFLPLIRK